MGPSCELMLDMIWTAKVLLFFDMTKFFNKKIIFL